MGFLTVGDGAQRHTDGRAVSSSQAVACDKSREGAGVKDPRSVPRAAGRGPTPLPRGPQPQIVPPKLSLGLGFPCGMNDLWYIGCDFPFVLLFLLKLERLGPFGK